MHFEVDILFQNIFRNNQVKTMLRNHYKKNTSIQYNIKKNNYENKIFTSYYNSISLFWLQ